jgi:hypothetical protein
MAIFPFRRSGEGQPVDEKGPSYRHETEDAATAGSGPDEGVVDEAHDDLHREMKPRQLSAFCYPAVLSYRVVGTWGARFLAEMR